LPHPSFAELQRREREQLRLLNQRRARWEEMSKAAAGQEVAAVAAVGPAIGSMMGGQAPTPEQQRAMQLQGMETGGAFAPGRPLDQFFPRGTPPRQWDYPTGHNTAARPRANTGRPSFTTLQGILQAWDVARLCIEHIEDDLRSLDWSIAPDEGVEEDVSDQVKAARKFFDKPDGLTPFDSWQQELLEDLLRFDAPAVFRRRTRNGKVGALEVVSGVTIAPLLDYYGRTPTPPAPAYVQYTNGVPAVWLTSDDLIYRPFRTLPESPYGLPPIEWLLLTANTDIRFQWHFLMYFTEGTVPEAFMEAPPDASDPEQLEAFQNIYDAAMEGDQAQKHRVRWIPHGSNPHILEHKNFDASFPLYLMRKTCAAFKVVPADIGITDTVNKASSETQMDVQFRTGTMPRVRYLQGLYTRILQDDLGLKGVQFKFDTGREKEDRLDEARAHQVYVSIGAESPDEVRKNVLGLEVDTENPVPRFVLSQRLGAIPLKSIVEISGDINPGTAAPEDVDLLDVPGYIAPAGVVPAPGDSRDVRAKQAAPQAATPVSAADVAGRDDDEEAAQPTVDSGEPSDRELRKELQRWRDNARKRVRAGRRPRMFESDLLPDPVADIVWSKLEKATSAAEVDDAFRLPFGSDRHRLIAAGLAVKADDTGRVLLLQRSTADPDDPAAGMWEFPGGQIEDGEQPVAAAKREWEEETGAELLPGEVVASWVSPNGIYQGFVYVIAHEADLVINLDHEDREVLNPDDPDGDQIEVIAWWDPTHLPDMPALRREAKATDWAAIAAARLPEARLAKALEHHHDERLAPTEDHFADALLDPLKLGLSGRAIARGWAARSHDEPHRMAKAVAQPDPELEQEAQAYVNGLTVDPSALHKLIQLLYRNGYLAGVMVNAKELAKLGIQVTGTLGAAVQGISDWGAFWAAWQPGNDAAADQLAAIGGGEGLAKLLEQARVTIRGIQNETLSRLARVLAAGARRGASVDEMADDLDVVLEDRARARTIATTELARSVSAATRDVYRQNAVERWDWMPAPDACATCEAIAAGGPYSLFDDMPPAHPNCRCTASPHLREDD
jgi:SPP1 gp7 family putative phage head morphogenesis protein